MNSQNLCKQPTCDYEAMQESRSARFNLPVRHPSRWALLREVFFSSPNRTHRYRILSHRMLETTIRKMNRGECE